MNFIFYCVLVILSLAPLVHATPPAQPPNAPPQAPPQAPPSSSPVASPAVPPSVPPPAVPPTVPTAAPVAPPSVPTTPPEAPPASAPTSAPQTPPQVVSPSLPPASAPGSPPVVPPVAPPAVAPSFPPQVGVAGSVASFDVTLRNETLEGFGLSKRSDYTKAIASFANVTAAKVSIVNLQETSVQTRGGGVQGSDAVEGIGKFSLSAVSGLIVTTFVQGNSTEQADRIMAALTSVGAAGGKIGAFQVFKVTGVTAAAPSTAEILARVDITISGVTAAAFGDTQRQDFITAVAQALVVPTSNVRVLDIQQTTVSGKTSLKVVTQIAMPSQTQADAAAATLTDIVNKQPDAKMGGFVVVSVTKSGTGTVLMPLPPQAAPNAALRGRGTSSLAGAVFGCLIGVVLFWMGA